MTAVVHGERAFTKAQYGLESAAAHGTPVVATGHLLCETIAVDDDTTPDYPSDNLGVRVASMRSIIYQQMAKGTLQFDNGYFGILPLLFACGLKGAVTGVEKTSLQHDYEFAYTPALDALNAPDSCTLRYGDNVMAYIAQYAMFQRLKFSGTIGQDKGSAPVKIEAEWFAQSWVEGAFTAAIAPPTTVEMNAKLARLYVNPSWATVGNTELANCLREWSVEILTGVHPDFYGSAQKTFDVHQEGDISVRFEFTLDENDTTLALRQAKDAGTLQIVRLAINGPQIGAGINHCLRIDASGTWDSVIPISGSDRGDNQLKATLYNTYDKTGAKSIQAYVCTNQSAP